MDQSTFMTVKALVKNEDLDNEPTKDQPLEGKYDGTWDQYPFKLFSKCEVLQSLLIFLDVDTEAQIETNENIIDQKDDNLLNVLLKPTNPWEVSSLYEFNYFCCPECDIKSTSAQEFINHASYYHPWVSQI